MKSLFLLTIILVLAACDKPDSKALSSEVIRVTTPDGVEIREGEIYQVFAGSESRKKFIEYLESQDMYYRLDDRCAMMNSG